MADLTKILAKAQTRDNRVAVDFDGVLTKYIKFTHKNQMGDPMEGSRDFLEKLARMKMNVDIYTARNPKDVRQWLERNNMGHLVNDVTNEKKQAIAYIDDRGIQFKGDYNDIINQLTNFEPYWKDK